MENPDRHLYSGISFHLTTFQFYVRSVEYYLGILKSESQAIELSEELLWLFNGISEFENPYKREIERIGRMLEYMRSKIRQGDDIVDISFEHRAIRFIKSVSLLYIDHLETESHKLATKSPTTNLYLERIQSQVSRFREKTKTGVLAEATPYPLLISQIPVETDEANESDIISVAPSTTAPRFIRGSVQILDTELSSRCLDLLEGFIEKRQFDRLDTVITEACRILEHRLRRLSGAEETKIGLDLATFAFKPNGGVLRLSTINSEQDGVMALFRGLYGYVRNPSHHKLTGDLNPDRTVQILAFIDYLLFLCESAERPETN